MLTCLLQTSSVESSASLCEVGIAATTRNNRLARAHV